MIVSLLFAAQIDESTLVADFVFSVFDSAIPSKGRRRRQRTRQRTRHRRNLYGEGDSEHGKEHGTGGISTAKVTANTANATISLRRKRSLDRNRSQSSIGNNNISLIQTPASFIYVDACLSCRRRYSCRRGSQSCRSRSSLC